MGEQSKRMTMAQVLIAFLKQQHVECDGVEQPFFAGCFGTRYAYPQNGFLPGDDAEGVAPLPVDLAANAANLGAHLIRCATYDDFVAHLKAAQDTDRTTVIYIQNDRLHDVPGYESWWDVPVAEVNEMPSVREARREWEEMRTSERYFL